MGTFKKREINTKEIISEYMRALQKKSSASRLKNDPNTYKKMRALKIERDREGELKIITE